MKSEYNQTVTGPFGPSRLQNQLLARLRLRSERLERRRGGIPDQPFRKPFSHKRGNHRLRGHQRRGNFVSSPLPPTPNKTTSTLPSFDCQLSGIFTPTQVIKPIMFQTVNISNAYEDDRFDPSVDEEVTFKHKTILCMPIKNSTGQIIGVIQLINKFNGLPFTKNDENFVEAFAIFCGMGIHNTHMYEKAMVAIAKQSVTLEVLSYHATATAEDAQRLRVLSYLNFLKYLIFFNYL